MNAEQLEAHQQSFLKYWVNTAIPAMLESGLSIDEIAGLEHGAWVSWLSDARLDAEMNKP